MPDTKISALTAVTTPTAASELPVNEAGVSKKLTLAQASEFSNGGVLIRQPANHTLTSSTTQQRLFDATTNGRTTLATGTYMFDAQLSLTTMSATSGNAAFSIKGGGTAVLADVLYHTVGVDGNSATAAAQSGSTTVATTGTSPASAVSAGTGTAVQMHIKGTFEVTTSGTIVPSITLVTAAAAVLVAGSYFRCKRIGAAGLSTIGTWD